MLCWFMIAFCRCEYCVLCVWLFCVVGVVATFLMYNLSVVLALLGFCLGYYLLLRRDGCGLV